MRLQDDKGLDREPVRGINNTKSSVKNVGVVGDVKQKTPHTNEDNLRPESEEVDTSCGIWRFRTNVFGRCFSNLYVFALFVGVSGLFSTMVDRIVPVQLTSLEKQFNIDNAKAGLLTSSSKFGLMSTILIAGHFTKRSNIPVIVGLSGVLQGFLLMIPAVLQFTNPYTLEIIDSGTNNCSHSQSEYLCNSLAYNKTRENSCNQTLDKGEAKQTDQVAFIIVLVIQVLKGVTDTFHSFFLPTVYMDDNAMDKSKMSIYMGIRQLFTNLAQPIGTEITGVLTEIPVDLKETQMDATDTRFVAAWWLAFFIFGAGTVLTSFPLVLFPKRLVSKKQQKQALDKAVITFAGGHLDEEKNVTEQTQKDEKENMKPIAIHPDQSSWLEKRYSLDVPRKNSLVSTGTSGSRRSSFLFPPTDGPTERKVSLTGDIVFDQPVVSARVDKAPVKESTALELIKDFPKAIFRLLKMPVFILILVDIAIVSIPYNGIAMFRNTYMANEYNIRMSEVSYASGVSAAIGHISGTLASSWLASRVTTKEGYVLIMLGSYLIQTALNPFYILFGCDNLPVYGSTGDMGVPVNTSTQCDCTHSKQLISCGSDGNNYLSPCYAGCSGVHGKNFIDCTLLQNVTTHGTSMVTPGLCPTDCHTNFMVYVVLHGVQYLAEGASQIPRNLLVLRLVDVRDRAFAISFFMFFGNVLSVPSPNIFGSIIDQTCLVWEGDFCSLYDREKIRYLLAGVDIGVNVAVMTALCINLLIFRWENRKLAREREKQGQGAEVKGQRDKNKPDKYKLDEIQPDKDQISVKITIQNATD